MGYELNGYNFAEEDRPLLAAMGRIVPNDPEKGYIAPLGTIEATIRAEEKRLESLRTPSLSGQWVNIALHSIHGQINSATSNVMTMSKIRSTVLGRLYSFATSTYHELAFGEAQEEFFTIARREIDGLLAPTSSNALSKVESIVERLYHGNEEAISQAMSTCRRLIDSFADAVYPAQSEPVVLGLGAGELVLVEEDQGDGADDAGSELLVNWPVQRIGRRLIRREVRTEASEAPLPLPDICVTALRLRLRLREQRRPGAGRDDRQTSLA